MDLNGFKRGLNIPFSETTRGVSDFQVFTVKLSHFNVNASNGYSS